MIEVDDALHFTSFRLAALELYPAGAEVGFDLEEHSDFANLVRVPDRRSVQGKRDYALLRVLGDWTRALGA